MLDQKIHVVVDDSPPTNPNKRDMWRKHIGTSIFSTRSAHTARAKNKLRPREGKPFEFCAARTKPGSALVNKEAYELRDGCHHWSGESGQGQVCPLFAATWTAMLNWEPGFCDLVRVCGSSPSQGQGDVSCGRLGRQPRRPAVGSLSGAWNCSELRSCRPATLGSAGYSC